MINKAVIVLSPPDTGPLALGKVVAPEFWLLHGQPLVERLVDEVAEAGVEEVVFVGPTEKKGICDYFRQKKTQAEGDDDCRFIESYGALSFSFVVGDSFFGSTLLKLKSKIKDEAFILVEADRFLNCEESSFVQLGRVFGTAEKTVLGMIPFQQGVSAAMLSAEKIAERIYKVKGVETDERGASFMLSGRSIIAPVIWETLGELKREGNAEGLDLQDILKTMIAEGKPVYGYQLKGEWFDLKKREGWLRANKSLVLKDDA